MKNIIKVREPSIHENRIIYSYEVEGEWRNVFKANCYYIEYSRSLCGLAKSVAIVPFLANLLPISWVYDAEIYLPYCDLDFFESINSFKQGYEKMYPMMEFKGRIIVEYLEKNVPNLKGDAATFFSGGVDAFYTLVTHNELSPTLITLWGADVFLEDVEGWDMVRKQIELTSRLFNVDYITIKSEFRRFLSYEVLSEKVAKSGDNWWHGFQHGIGIICHAAPITYLYGKTKIYFASSYSQYDKKRVTCASDPSIDNKVRYCGATVEHDGFDHTRQNKIQKLVSFSKKTKILLPLRVCWQLSARGGNCCTCEKCWRTMLGIYAEGADPKEYGFEYSERMLKKTSRKMRFKENAMHGGDSFYEPIQLAMKENLKKRDLPVCLRWFYNADLNKVGHASFGIKVYRKIKFIL